MRYVILSHFLSNKIPTYGNRDGFFVGTNSSIKKGDTSNTSTWYFSNNHLGTHIDVPFHFCQNGKKTIDYFPEDFIFNNVEIVDIPCDTAKLIKNIDFKSLQINSSVELLLIRTGYEQFRKNDKYWNDNPGLDHELADYFREYYPKLRCVGFDFISLTSWKFREEGKKSHKKFLCPENNDREILVIEDMKLSIISSNKLFQVIVAPVFTEEGNGGPVTIFASIK